MKNTNQPPAAGEAAHTPTPELPHRVKFLGNLLVSDDESVVIGTFHNVQGRPDYREAILRRLNK